MNMRRNNNVLDISLNEGLLEDTTSFIIHYFKLGLVYISCECVKEFQNPLLMHALDIDGRVSVKIALLL